MYDIIGDIHGHADELIELMELLGYKSANGIYQHLTRTAVFVGDFIDRGPQIREVLAVVRPMHEAGSALAVMGNHEFNALAFHTLDPAVSGQHLRIHSEKNQKQHAATLHQISSGELLDHLEWFRSLPMWLELDGLRVVHACWDAEQMHLIETKRKEQDGVSTGFLCEAAKAGTPLFHAIEDVLKGKELRLPDGKFYIDKDGHERHQMRIKWFLSPVDQSFASYALFVGENLPEEPLPLSLMDEVTPYPSNAKPVFFGHYWLRADRPIRLAPNVACVDYSVAKGGMLCAYRWDGERVLSDDKFVCVRCKQ